MRIAFDAKRYYHNHTGLGNYSRTLVNSLKEFFPDHEYVLYDEKSFARTFKLGRKAASEGCQIYHGLSNELPLDSRKASVADLGGASLKTMVTIHDVCWRTFPKMYGAIDRFLYERKYGWAICHADLILSISQSTKQDILQYYRVPEDRVRTVYQPVQSLFYKPLPADEARSKALSVVAGLPKDFLLSVGSVNSRKNLLGTLKALSALAPGNRPPLLVVGSGHSYYEECRKFASACLRPNDVIWLDKLTDNATLQALYACALAMVYPSFYEGFGLPVVESLLQHTPVLTSNVSSLPEAGGPGALYANPADVDELSDKLQALVDDASLRSRLAEEGESYCRASFDPRSLMGQVMDLYEQLIG